MSEKWIRCNITFLGGIAFLGGKKLTLPATTLEVDNALFGLRRLIHLQWQVSTSTTGKSFTWGPFIDSTDTSDLFRWQVYPLHPFTVFTVLSDLIYLKASLGRSEQFCLLQTATLSPLSPNFLNFQRPFKDERRTGHTTGVPEGPSAISGAGCGDLWECDLRL